MEFDHSLRDGLQRDPRWVFSQEIDKQLIPRVSRIKSRLIKVELVLRLDFSPFLNELKECFQLFDGNARLQKLLR